jgi:hypothetical protein
LVDNNNQSVGTKQFQNSTFNNTKGYNLGNKMISASPASHFMSAKDKAKAHKDLIGAKKKHKYAHKPIHRVLNNFMDDDEEEDVSGFLHF